MPLALLLTHESLYKFDREGLIMFQKAKRIIAVFLSMALMLTFLISEAVMAYAEEDYDGDYIEETEDASGYTAEEASEEGSEDQNENLKRGDLGGYKGLVAHWKFDGDLKDSSEFKNDGEAAGGKSGVTFVDAVLGKGVKLDGKSYIEVADSDSLDLQDGFTFSFWVYKDDNRKKERWDGGIPYLMKYEDGSYQNDEHPYGVYEWWEMTPGVTYYTGEESGDVHAEKQLDIQKWTLISATYDGKTMKIYRDKELVKSELKSVTLARSFSPLYIGFAHFQTTDNYFKGILDDMRIYNKALTYGEIEDLYDEAVSEGSGKDLVNKPNRMVAYYKFENDLKDLSVFNNDGVAIKAKNFKYVDGKAGKAIKFGGASYVEIMDSDSLDIDRGFTIGMWINMEKTKSDTQPIFYKYGESNDKKEYSYGLHYWSESGESRLELSDYEDNVSSGAQTFYINEKKEAAAGRWFYYTATYQGSDPYADEQAKDVGMLKQYINGKLVSSEEFDTSIAHSSGPLWIGGSTAGVYFKGIMDEFRIYNYGMTPAQVKELYHMVDRLQVAAADKKVKLSALKPKQTVQLKTDLLKHTYIPSDNIKQDGKDEMKRQDVTKKASYQSSNEKIAKVSDTGKITAVGKGKAVITVTYGNYSQTVSIVVR